MPSGRTTSGGTSGRGRRCRTTGELTRLCQRPNGHPHLPSHTRVRCGASWLRTRSPCPLARWRSTRPDSLSHTVVHLPPATANGSRSMTRRTSLAAIASKTPPRGPLTAGTCCFCGAAVRVLGRRVHAPYGSVDGSRRTSTTVVECASSMPGGAHASAGERGRPVRRRLATANGSRSET